MYVYLSNESGEAVFFDNFTVSHERGQLIGEDHYYAYGLRIASISSRSISSSLNLKMVSYGYQGSYSEELSEFGLNYNEFFLRTYDPQIGRWTAPDPFDEFASPYVGMGADPAINTDPSGGSVFGDLMYISMPKLSSMASMGVSNTAATISNTLTKAAVSVSLLATAGSVFSNGGGDALDPVRSIQDAMPIKSAWDFLPVHPDHVTMEFAYMQTGHYVTISLNATPEDYEGTHTISEVYMVTQGSYQTENGKLYYIENRTMTSNSVTLSPLGQRILSSSQTIQKLTTKYETGDAAYYGRKMITKVVSNVVGTPTIANYNKSTDFFSEEGKDIFDKARSYIQTNSISPLNLIVEHAKQIGDAWVKAFNQASGTLKVGSKVVKLYSMVGIKPPNMQMQLDNRVLFSEKSLQYGVMVQNRWYIP